MITGSSVKSSELRELQAPLKERYRAEPEAALVTLRAHGRLGEGGPDLQGRDRRRAGRGGSASRDGRRRAQRLLGGHAARSARRLRRGHLARGRHGARDRTARRHGQRRGRSRFSRHARRQPRGAGRLSRHPLTLRSRHRRAGRQALQPGQAHRALLRRLSNPPDAGQARAVRGDEVVTERFDVAYLVSSGTSTAARCPELLRGLVGLGFSTVIAIPTPNASRVVASRELADLEGVQVVESYFDLAIRPRPPRGVVLFAPCSFNSLNKLAHGIADSLALSVVAEAIGRSTPVIVGPSSNAPLLEHPQAQASLKKLPEWGVIIVPPVDEGEGTRLAPTAALLDAVRPYVRRG